jgi:hypothetical protein
MRNILTISSLSLHIRCIILHINYPARPSPPKDGPVRIRNLACCAVRQPIPNEAQAEQRLRLGYGFLAIGEKIFYRVQKEGRVQRLGAYGDRIPPKENVSLSQVEVEDILLAPLAWCPHPENMISMYLEGDSMYPVIPPESIIFVDTASTKRERLHQRLTVVSHRDLGFKVARFQRLSGSDLLVSANHKYVPVDVSSASKWKIFGEVLWWVSRDAEPKA